MSLFWSQFAYRKLITWLIQIIKKYIFTYFTKTFECMKNDRLLWTFLCNNWKIHMLLLLKQQSLFSLPHAYISVSHGVTAPRRSSTTPTSTPSPMATSSMIIESCLELYQNSPTGTRKPSVSSSHFSGPLLSFFSVYITSTCWSYLCALHT